MGNRESLTRAVSSVFDQTYTNWEIVIVSNDEDLFTKFSLEQNSKIRFIKQKKFGIYENFNLGIEQADGLFLAILNDDDWYESDFLEASLQFITDRNLDGSYGNCWIHEQDGNKKLVYAKPILQKGLLTDFIGAYHTTFLLKRECFQRYGLFKHETSKGIQLNYASDYHWFIHALKAGLIVERHDRICGHFSLGGASSTERKTLIMEGKAAALDHTKDVYARLLVYFIWQARFFLNIFKL